MFVCKLEVGARRRKAIYKCIFGLRFTTHETNQSGVGLFANIKSSEETSATRSTFSSPYNDVSSDSQKRLRGMRGEFKKSICLVFWISRICMPSADRVDKPRHWNNFHLIWKSRCIQLISAQTSPNLCLWWRKSTLKIIAFIREVIPRSIKFK